MPALEDPREETEEVRWKNVSNVSTEFGVRKHTGVCLDCAIPVPDKRDLHRLESLEMFENYLL